MRKALWITLVTLFVAIGAPYAHADPFVTLNSFSQMPTNNTTLLLNYGDPIFGNNGLVSNLAQQGITISYFDGTPLNSFAYQNNAYGTSPIAPAGTAIAFTPVLFTFANPVYAVGGTFFASQNDPNLPDAVFEVDAFGKNGKLLGPADSSSFTERNGPAAIYVNVGDGEAIASFAGIWSNLPISQAVFMLADPMGGQQRADWSAFSYSSTPLHRVPEPSTLLLLGTGLLSLVDAIRRKRFV